MAINFNDNIQVNAPKGIDAKYMKFTGGLYQPYASSTEANTIVQSFYRYQFLTVLCLMNGDPVEYWWQGGIADINLVPKHKESYTLNVNGSINLSNNYLYTGIVIVPANNLTNLIIGFTNGGTDLEFGAAVTAGTSYTLSTLIYGTSIQLFFGGILTGTKIILYKDF